MKRNVFICIEIFQFVCFSAKLFLFFLGRGSLRTGVRVNSAAKNFVWEGPIELIDVVLSLTVPSVYFLTV